MRNNRQSCQQDEGFTLIETLISIFIISVIMLASRDIITSIVTTGKHISSRNSLTKKMMTLSMQLNRDILEIAINERYPLKLTRSNNNCISRFEFYTKNRANPENMYSDSLYKVKWEITDGVITRSVSIDSGLVDSEKKIYPMVRCFYLTEFTDGRWRDISQTEKHLSNGLAWKVLMANGLVIEQVIPEGKP